MFRLYADRGTDRRSDHGHLGGHDRPPVLVHQRRENFHVGVNIHALRTPIELYRAEHLTTYPTITNNSLPQLTGTTDVNGNVGTGAAFIYGPYINAVPINPLNGLATIGPVPTPGTPPAAGDGQYGYQYDATTGNIYPDQVGWTYSP